MKKLIVLTAFTLAFHVKAQLGINTEKLEPSAILTVAAKSQDGHYKGVLVTPMSTAEIDALVLPPKGLVVYDLTERCLKINFGTPQEKRWLCLSKKNTV